MRAVQAALVCAAAALICAVLRPQRPEMAFAVALAAGVAALVLLSDDLRTAVSALSSMASAYGLQDGSLSMLVKAAGIALLAEFAAQLCRDAGEGALAGRIHLAARVAMLAMAAPVLAEIMELVSEALS